ncbi:MAG: hypothetical protein HOO66_01865 [Nitrosarchaeum sp.]|nr:hypothetical protein [Nitrosarchaeum sp.]
MQFQLKRNRMLNFYYDIETQFIELTRIIPLDNTDDTYSPRLYSILQMSCGQVENMLRLICDKFGFKYTNPDKQNTKPNFFSYYNPINKNGILSTQWILLKKIDFRDISKSYSPLELQSERAPFWWTGYNETKHDLPDGFKQGNLKNTLYALCAVYSIHCMAYYAQHIEKPDIFLDKKNWVNLSVSYTGDGELIMDSLTPLPKSKLFYCGTRFNSDGALI